jgi:hypothetical protein
VEFSMVLIDTALAVAAGMSTVLSDYQIKALLQDIPIIGGLSVAEKKGTKMAAKWSPTNKPFGVSLSLL